MTAESQDFDVAPASGLGRFSVHEVLALVISFVAADALVVMKSHSRALDFGDFMAPLFAALLGFAMSPWKSRIKRFRIEGATLLVGKESYKLGTLQEAVRDRGAMDGAHRRWVGYRCWGGKSRLGGRTDSFKSPRLGEFRAYVTDREKSVVLRWPGETLVVSPADPEFFVLLARKGAVLPR